MKYYTGPWICSGQEQLAGFCQHDNGNSDSIEDGESFQWVNTCFSWWTVLHGVLWYHARHMCSHLFYSVWVSGLIAVEKHGCKWPI